jgi:bisphosphoglycerate-independent phosphoglycerate mutase (AlkP superfamily)
MSEQYMKSVSKALSCVEKLKNSISDDYTIVLLADHGGHDRSHGSDLPEDMTIPVLFCGKPFEKGKEISDVSIKDVAVTIAKLLDVPIVKEWEGKALV